MKLFYRKYGEGPYLMILHGLYGSSDNWITIAKKLSDVFTVILPDQRNHGLSPHSEIHSYNAMADDLMDLVERLKIQKFLLAGHSMGGKTAMTFALKWPERLNGLLVADISPFSAGRNAPRSLQQHLEILNAVISADLKRASSRKQVETILSETIKSAGLRALMMKNLQREADGSFSWKINARIILDNLHGIMGEIDLRENNSAAGFPVVFLKGEHSDFISFSEYEEIRRIFPSAGFFEVKGSGHWLHTDNPDAVIEHLLMLGGVFK